MPELKIYDVTVKIIQGDISELEVDAIVNAANNRLVMGGGVAGAIRNKGGMVIEEDAVKKGPIEIGQAVASVAGDLKAKYVIHAATMGMDFATDEHKIRSSCRNALRVAAELKIRSVAFPALGCGAGGFPVVAAAKIMAQEVLRLLKKQDTTLKEIIFCLYNREDYDVFVRHALGYLDHMVYQIKTPYSTVDAIIEQAGGIVLIQRRNPPFGWALPGGFVDYGESLEEAVVREIKEETNLELSAVRQFHTYSAPGRDPRFHTIATVFTGQASGELLAGDDAAGAKVFKAAALPADIAFDHRQILEDYFASQQKK